MIPKVRAGLVGWWMEEANTYDIEAQSRQHRGNLMTELHRKVFVTPINFLMAERQPAT
jgi:hypothetical protein